MEEALNNLWVMCSNFSASSAVLASLAVQNITETATTTTTNTITLADTTTTTTTTTTVNTAITGPPPVSPKSKGTHKSNVQREAKASSAPRQQTTTHQCKERKKEVKKERSYKNI